MTDVTTFDNVWDAIADTRAEAASLQAKAELTHKIIEIIKKQNLKQKDAAKYCGITQPRLNDLLRGRISRFSLDALVNIAATIGQKVHIELEAA